MSNLDFALDYAKKGLAVFPLHSVPGGKCTCGFVNCKSPGKHPLTQSGVKDASIDAEKIKEWWTDNPLANIGIATGSISNLIVVDFDTIKGASKDDLEDYFDTLTVRTGAGWHYYYLLPKGIEIKNSASRLGKFIDVRGEGGYVVAPPSVHITGNIYKFTNEKELLEFPAEWIARLNSFNRPAAYTNGNGNSKPVNSLVVPPPYQNLVVPENINSGSRNAELTRIAGSLRRIGLIEKEIEASLEKINLRVCQPPLDIQEVRQISHSVGRYKTENIKEVEDKNTDFENTLKPYLLKDFLIAEFEELEILGFHISPTEIGIIQAPTNAGKTTILRNAALAMACGRPFLPFFDGHRPIRTAYFDFESSAQRAQPDLIKMVDVLTDEEKKLAGENLILIPKGLMKGELFQFNSGESWVNSLLTGNGVEFVIVDNISAAYDLNDENSNAEINKKVIKPLLKMAYKGNCAFLFAHHYGKGKTELESAGVHAGRGASNLQSLSQTVINMFGNVSKGETITIECAKRKTDGGQNYREVFELRDDRWFHQTTIVPPPKQRSCAETLNDFINDHFVYPETVTPAELADVFDGVFGIDMINKSLKTLADNGFISKPVRGEYSARKKKDITVLQKDFAEL